MTPCWRRTEFYNVTTGSSTVVGGKSGMLMSSVGNTD